MTHPVRLDVGDVVTLNSGGPQMTVIEMQGEQIKAAWTDDDAKLEAAWFPRVCLTRLHVEEH